MLSYRTTPRSSALATEDEELIERTSPLYPWSACGSTTKRQNRLFEASSFGSNLDSAFTSYVNFPSLSSSNTTQSSPIFRTPETLYPFNTLSSSSFLVEDCDAHPSRYRRKRCSKTEEPTFEYDFPRLPASNSTSTFTPRLRNRVPRVGLRPHLTGVTTRTQRKEAFPLSPSTSDFAHNSGKTLPEVSIQNRPRSSTLSSDDTLFSEQDPPIGAKDSLDPGVSAADIIPAIEEASPSVYASPKSLLASDEDTYPESSSSWFNTSMQRSRSRRHRGGRTLEEDGEQENEYKPTDGEQEDVFEGRKSETTKHSSIEEFKYTVRHRYAAVVMRWQLGVLGVQRRCRRQSKNKQ